MNFFSNYSRLFYVPVFISGFLFFLSLPLSAQIDSLAEDLINEEDEQGNIIDWVETLAANPLDINTAPEKYLSEMPFLRPEQVALIMTNRPFTKKTDLAHLLGRAIYLKIRPFIVLKKTQSVPKVLLTHRQQYTLEKNKATRDHLFYGSPFETLTRLKIRMPGHFSGSLLIQKDAGESRFNDHLSGYVAWDPPEFPLKIIAGNYYLHAGEGLLFSGPYLPSSRTLIEGPPQQKTCLLKPFSSANEVDGFLGTALQWKYSERFEITALISKYQRDAVLNDASDAIIRLDRTGYHRSKGEMQTVNRVREESAGLISALSLKDNSIIGMIYSKTTYFPGFEVLNDEEKRRDHFRFEGSEVTNFSFFYFIKTGFLLLKGELVPLKRSTPAQQHSLTISQAGSTFFLRFSCLPNAFKSPHGRHLSGSQPFPRGLQQFLFGFSYRPSNDLFLSAYWSVEKDLWRTYFNPLPLIKKSTEIYAVYSPFSETQFSLRYHHSTSSQYQSNLAIARLTDKLRLQIEKKISPRFRIRSRIEKAFVQHSSLVSKKSGFSFYQDMRWHPDRFFTFTIRFSSFQCDNYDARIYEFENGIPGIYANYPLYGSGNKVYAVFTFSPLPDIKIWLKYRQTNYDAVEQIGSGITAISGSTRQDVQFQIEYRY